MTAHLCFTAKKKCYATMWSYGEICVGCNCCGSPSPQRDRARLEYWQEELNRLENFSCFSNEPEIRQIQEANIGIDLPRTRRLVRYYKRKVT